MPNYASFIQYDGTGFAGWQCQPEDRTVQGELEAVLAKLGSGPVRAHAAGRTDAGVHALRQVVSFQLERDWSPDDLRRAVNSLLPRDVWVEAVRAVPAHFHARKSALSRRYRYILGTDDGSRSPFRRPFEWSLGRPVGLERLTAAAALLPGRHNFQAFAAVGAAKPHYECNVLEAGWSARPSDQGFIFTIEADRFLHRMVRFLVGTMVEIAIERRDPADMQTLLGRTDNSDTSPPAPPQGLYMLGARYQELEEEPLQ